MKHKHDAKWTETMKQVSSVTDVIAGNGTMGFDVKAADWCY